MSRSFYKPALLLIALVLLGAVGLIQKDLNRRRADPAIGFTRVAPLENAPPVLAFTTVALGGFRGLIANALWIRAGELQDEGKYFEMMQLADWITKLEPHFVQVWNVQAWNMAYNISIKFNDPADRWRWVRAGIELLRDQGIRYNPGEPLLYRELAWFFHHKMGQNLDDGHLFFKTAWAHEMQAALGGDRPNYDELLRPQTDAARQRVEMLRTRYKLDPAFMKAADDLYGPLEWRLPETHSIYWATVGLAKVKNKELLALRRAVYQSLHLAVLRGRIVLLPTNGFVITGPDLGKAALANDGYEKMIAEEKEKPEAIKNAHRGYLKELVYLLYTHNRRIEAGRYLQQVREKYPDSIPPGQSLDEYALARLSGNLTSLNRDKTILMVEGLVRQYYTNLALDEDERAEGLDAMARQLWSYYTERIGNQGPRLGLPGTLPEMKEAILQELLGPQTPYGPITLGRLLTKLGRPVPTNSPPASTKP